MGLLTLLDSRSHRNANIWKQIVRLVVYVTRRRSFDVER
jgi:hypothetical protein